VGGRLWQLLLREILRSKGADQKKRLRKAEKRGTPSLSSLPGTKRSLVRSRIFGTKGSWKERRRGDRREIRGGVAYYKDPSSNGAEPAYLGTHSRKKRNGSGRPGAIPREANKRKKGE